MGIIDQLPCAILVTDVTGLVCAVNKELLELTFFEEAQLLGKNIDEFLPLPSRIFMQTHLWPMLLRDGHLKEIYLKIGDAFQRRIPVLVNCTKGQFRNQEHYFWVFFVTVERSEFEEQLVKERKRIEEINIELTNSERFIKEITNSLPSLVAYWSKDLSCQFANDVYLEWFGKKPEEMIGMKLRDLLGGELFSLNEPYIQGVLAGEAQHFERTITKHNGSIGYTLAHYNPDVNNAGEVVGFYVLVSDVTALKLAQADLKLAASVYTNIVEGIIVTDENWRITNTNPAFTKITGFRPEEVLGKEQQGFNSNQYDNVFYKNLRREIDLNGRWEGELWSRRSDGEAFLKWQTMSIIRGSGNQPTRYVSLFTDITERWQKDERIRYLAFHDALTELANRTLFLERLGQLIAGTVRKPRNVAILGLDLDGFKQINDKWGHDIGDEVLKQVAQRMLNLIRSSDTAARFGGDEFMILLDNPLDAKEVVTVLTRLIAAINEPIVFSQVSISIGVSVGVVIFPEDGHLPVQLLKRVDSAMYSAKNCGKNTYRFYSEQSGLLPNGRR